MDRFIIQGGKKLQGNIPVSGAKNAALPLLAASLLTTEPLVLHNVPDLRDIRSMLDILQVLGVESKRDGDRVTLQTKTETERTAPYELVRTMRASFCVLGPLLAKRGNAKVSLPGGCVIGPRPVDLHLKGMRKLGVSIEIDGGYVIAEGKKITPASLFLEGAFGSSVGATVNVAMAAVLADGTTVIEGAACEPEVQDLMICLNAMGADISGIGTPVLKITGVKELHGAHHTVIPDRIEAGTFLFAAGITRSELTVSPIRQEHLGGVVNVLSEIGIPVEFENGACRVKPAGRFEPVDVTTLPYPGFPTDLQAQGMAVLSIADGLSVVSEKIYPDRFMHIAELGRMGANIRKEGNVAIIDGVERLTGAPVMASDLRGSAALVLAGLAASGTTEVDRVYHIDRGYEQIERKFQAAGADIQRVSDKSDPRKAEEIG